MRTDIMVEWLSMFYRHIGSRTILLCMDDLKAHIKGIELAPPSSNIRIVWLPKGSTNIFQPLGQGVIQNFKIHYRRQWLAYTITQFQNDSDPYSTVTVYSAVLWGLSAWKYSVSNTIIYCCFRKSSIIQPRVENLPTEPRPEIAQLYAEAQRVGHIQDAMRFHHFLNPADEDLAAEEVTLEEIIELHTGEYIDDGEAILEDVEPPPEDIPSLKEAIVAVQTLLRYHVRQEWATFEEILFLERYERSLLLEEAKQKSQ
jgi:hypothetical protein